MTKKIGHSLEKLQRSLEKKRKVTWKHIPEEGMIEQTYTIECPHCKRFFEFQLEVKR